MFIFRVIPSRVLDRIWKSSGAGTVLYKLKTLFAILLLAVCAAHAGDQKPAAKSAGKWQISTDKNPVDNSPRICLSLQAEGGGNAPLLYVRKTGDTIEVYIVYSATVAGHYGADVTTRWDSAKPVTHAWGADADGKTVFCHFLPEFFDGLMKCHKLAVSVTPPDGKPIASVFQIDGFTKAVQSLGIIELPVEGSQTPPPAPTPEILTFPPPQPPGSSTGFDGTGG